MEPPRCRKNKTECKMTLRNEEPHVNKRFPRVRGDVPIRPEVSVLTDRFSPRARGCSLKEAGTIAKSSVFPACAGMFPKDCAWCPFNERFPRVRGDVPALG